MLLVLLLDVCHAELMHHIEDLPGVLVQSSKFDVQSNSILIIDGMAVVNQVTKDHTVKTWRVSKLL